MKNAWKEVLCSHEEAQELAGGRDWLGDFYPGVALPSTKALGKWVEIEYEGRWTPARVMDVGPWSTDDNLYVFGGGRPRAEIFVGERCRIEDGGKVHSLKSNGAGIDLFPETAKALGIPIGENVIVEWRFLGNPEPEE